MSPNIIKNYSSAAPPRRNLVKARVVEAQTEAQQILAAAESKAAEIVAKAEFEAVSLRQTAYREAAENALAECAEMTAAALDKRERVLIETERELLRLAVKLAEKIIGRELETNKNTVADMVSNALRYARQQERLTVRVNPADYPRLEELKDTLTQTGRAAFLDLLPDPRITSGGCLIESEVGTIDARLETQLKILERALLGQSETA